MLGYPVFGTCALLLRPRCNDDQTVLNGQLCVLRLFRGRTYNPWLSNGVERVLQKGEEATSCTVLERIVSPYNTHYISLGIMLIAWGMTGGTYDHLDCFCWVAPSSVLPVEIYIFLST